MVIDSPIIDAKAYHQSNFKFWIKTVAFEEQIYRQS